MVCELSATHTRLPLAQFLLACNGMNRLVYGAANLGIFIEMRRVTENVWVRPSNASQPRFVFAMHALMRAHPLFGDQNYMANLMTEHDDDAAMHATPWAVVQRA